FTKAVELAREHDDPIRVGAVLSNLGNLAMFRGDFAEARRLLAEGVESYGESGGDRRLTIATTNLGVVEFLDGDLVEAERLFRAALSLARGIHERREEAQLLRWLARTRLELGAADDARTLLEDSIPPTDEVGDRHGIAVSLEIAAAVAAAGGHGLEAAQLLGAAEAARASIGAHRAPDASDWYARTRARVEELVPGNVFDAELERGRKLSPDDALRLVHRPGRPAAAG
ncbi:MAG: tetratricopeptide repeat protein, partial [Gaiellaceae bacterium]